MNDYKTLLELLEKYNEEAIRVFKKLQKADQEAKTDILQYGYYSVFGRIEWYCANKNYITVRYYDECGYGSSTLIIPVDILFDDAKIDEWTKTKIDKVIEEKELEQKACGNDECSKEHKQLAEWLKELQTLKMNNINSKEA